MGVMFTNLSNELGHHLCRTTTSKHPSSWTSQSRPCETPWLGLCKASFFWPSHFSLVNFSHCISIVTLVNFDIIHTTTQFCKALVPSSWISGWWWTLFTTVYSSPPKKRNWIYHCLSKIVLTSTFSVVAILGWPRYISETYWNHHSRILIVSKKW